MKILNILKPSNLTRGSLNFTPFFPFSNKVDPSKNWYKVLQVDKSATPEDIKKSYYNLAKKYHPDVNKGSDEHFKEINTAYEILSNEDSRRNFDHFLAGDRYSSSVQNKYSSYHYGYNMRGKSRHSKANENYYGSSQKDNEQFYYQAYSYKKKNDYEKRKWEQFYSDDKENRGPTYDDLNVGRREYDGFVKRLMFYPMLFVFMYSIFFFLPSRNMSKEFVLFDEHTGRVYVTDKETYDEMKKNLFKNPHQHQSPYVKYPPQIQMRRDFQA